MKKIYGIFFILIIAFSSARACDICGCGVGSYYIGILPEFHKKIIGLRYRYNSLQTHLGAGGSTSYLTTDESYRTAELWGGWTIGSRFRIMAYIPVNFNEKINQGKTVSKNGVGDIGVQAFYQVFNKSEALDSKILVHSLWLGAGIKLPTGKYDAVQRNNATLQDANIFQLGTGSTDFTVNAMYDIRIQDIGISTTASYKMNTANTSHYSYGNKFSGAAQLYYKFRIKDLVTMAPNAGFMYETAGKDKDGKYEMDISGGNLLSGAFGMEISFNKLGIGANWQTPISQGLAGGFVRAKDRIMIHISVPF